MSTRRNLLAVAGWLALAAACLGGCAPPAAAPPPPKPPEVEYRLPVIGEVTDHEDFTGQTDAAETIDIRSRVTGYLNKVMFEHGAEVNAGTLLFEVDPRSYEAELDKAEAAISQSQAKIRRLRADYRRAETLLPTGGITRQQFDLISADLADAEAGLKSSEASGELASLNLSFTKIKAPIHGRLSRPYIDPGNLVKGDDTILTRIVSLDPMFVYFDIDERTMLRLRRLAQSKSGSSSTPEPVTVYMRLADEQGYPHRGQMDFEDNRLDTSTGTLRVRAVFDNTDRLLSPGLFVRVRLPIDEPHRAILVPELALGTDQGQKFLYVIDDQDEAQYRRVKVARLHDGMREIVDGVKPEDKIVVNGLQRVRPGAKVEAKLSDAPLPKTAAQ